MSSGSMKGQKSERGKFDATFAYFNDMRLFKQNDYRCLKASNSVKPEKWPHYEMKGYRNAKTSEDLEKVKEIEYNKYFNNFEDPKVFKEMMNTKKGSKLWQKTYGFDFFSFNHRRKQPAMDYYCFRYCYKEERGEFARYCRKEGGFFKCCLAK